MDLSLQQFQAYIQYYAIQRSWKEIELFLSSTHNNKHQNDEVSIFWNAVCCLKRSDLSQCTHFFKQIASHSDYNLASQCGLVEAYLRAQETDADHQQEHELDSSQISKLKSNIKKLSKTDNAQRLLHTAIYFWQIERLKQARHYAERALDLDGNNPHILSILGWIYLSEHSSKYTKKAPTCFANALKNSPNPQKTKGQELPLLAMYGLTKCYEQKGKLSKAIECITQLIVHNPWFVDGLSIKAELQLLIGQQQQCMDTMKRVLSTESHSNNIQCLVIKLCYYLVYHGNHHTVLAHLQSMYSLFITDYELNKYASYASLLYNISQITCKYMIDSTEILEMCQKFISIAVELEPENTTYLTLQANLYLYLGYTDTALQFFRDAVTLDENNAEALCKAVWCRLVRGEVNDAKQELQLIMETTADLHSKQSKSMNHSEAHLYLLQATIAWQADQDEEKFNLYMRSCVEIYINNIRSSRFSQYTDLAIHHPRFSIMIAKEYLKHAPSEPLSSADPPSAYLTEASNILLELCERIPGMVDALLLYAKCKYLEGDIYGCESVLVRLKEIDHDHWRTHLLQSQVALYANSNNEAQSCLDTVIGLNFQIQSTLIYHVIKSKLLQSNSLYQEAINLLESMVEKIYSYIEEKNKLKQNASPTKAGVSLSQKKSMLFSKYEAQMEEEEFINLCIGMIIQLSQLYKTTNQMNKAKQLMSTARSQFKGQNEMILIRLSEVRMLLKQGEVDAALASLHGIPSTSSYYTRGRLLIADIYLKHKRNKKMYIEIFEQLVRESPNDIHCQLLLGDAYMNIQRTSDAIHAYEHALMMSDYDEKLALKFGRALIASHDYQRAILHFEATLGNTACSVDIKAELAELYIQFQEYDKAKALLNESLANNSETYHDLEANTKMLVLFAELYQNVHHYEDAKALLTLSWSFQQKLLIMANSSGKELKPVETMASKICYNLGYVSLRLNDTSAAEEYLSKAAEYDTQNENAMIEMHMARVHHIKGQYDSAKEKLKSILSMNQSNEDAVLLLVELCVDQQDLKSAITELKLFRGTNPFNVKVLLQLIKLLRRTGQFEPIKSLLLETETAINDPANNFKINANNNSFAAISAGMRYVKGYVAWYVDNDSAEAIQQLNSIRNDVNWGAMTLKLMIKIYLYWSPGVTFIDVLTRYSHAERHEQLRVCQALIKELKYFLFDDPSALCNGCLCLLAAENANALEKASKTLHAICKKFPTHIQSHIASACALYAQQLPNKAISLLERYIVENKKKMKLEGYQYFEDFQELMLTLLQLKMNQMIGDCEGDHDREEVEMKEEMQAIQKMCLDILQKDASCSKAWELCAIATEKQGNIESACIHFKTAWDLHNKKNALLGYYLARTLLKLKRYMECIDIAHQVVDIDRSYKHIENIIELALSRVRNMI